MSNYLPHQVAKGTEAAALLRQHGVCYLAGEVRSGKTRTAIYALSQLPVQRVLWLTKKAAISGIERELAACRPSASYTVTNYEQCVKLTSDQFDMVVCDESHVLGSVPKPSLRVKAVRAIARTKPVLLLSGTPAVETSLALFHQFCVTNHTPFKFASFYKFFAQYGVPKPLWVNGRNIEQYKLAKPSLLADADPYIVRMTQDDANITAKAVDIVHKFSLDQSTVDMLDQMKADMMLRLPGHSPLAFESDMLLRTSLHQAEAGALLIDDQIVHLPNTEMVDYIRATFGDSPDVAVMAHYRSTREKIARHLPNVHIYSSDGHAEGTDLSHYKHFVVANSGYSGAKFVQRRDRGTRIGVDTERRVNHLIVAGQLSEAVYSSVSRKLDFNIATFRKCLRPKSNQKYSTISSRLMDVGL